MRKQLLAVLCLIGIAGLNAPSRAQVLKGSKSSTKSESTIKLDKAKQEQNADAAAAAEKDKKNATALQTDKKEANDKLHTGTNTTVKDSSIKGNKSAAEKTAATKNATVKASKAAQSTPK